MGLFRFKKGPHDTQVATDIATTDQVTEKTVPASTEPSGSDSDNLSLEARNDLEIQAHPDEITADAQPGVQKAEAAALVWGKPAVYSTYAW